MTRDKGKYLHWFTVNCRCLLYLAAYKFLPARRYA